MAGSVNYRLSMAAIVVMIFIAAIADLFTLIPLAGDIIGPVYWVAVSIFLYTKGFGLVNGRRLTTSLISMIAEMIPAIQELPLLLGGTIVLVVFSRLEDRTGISLTKGKIGIAKGPTPRVMNVDGVRQPSGRV